ncbi:hypothetical protein BDAP_001642 [Binucleata daphniae]
MKRETDILNDPKFYNLPNYTIFRKRSNTLALYTQSIKNWQVYIKQNELHLKGNCDGKNIDEPIYYVKDFYTVYCTKEVYKLEGKMLCSEDKKINEKFMYGIDADWETFVEMYDTKQRCSNENDKENHEENDNGKKEAMLEMYSIKNTNVKDTNESDAEESSKDKILKTHNKNEVTRENVNNENNLISMMFGNELKDEILTSKKESILLEQTSLVSNKSMNTSNVKLFDTKESNINNMQHQNTMQDINNNKIHNEIQPSNTIHNNTLHSNTLYNNNTKQTDEKETLTKIFDTNKLDVKLADVNPNCVIIEDNEKTQTFEIPKPKLFYKKKTSIKNAYESFVKKKCVTKEKITVADFINKNTIFGGEKTGLALQKEKQDMKNNNERSEDSVECAKDNVERSKDNVECAKDNVECKNDNAECKKDNQVAIDNEIAIDNETTNNYDCTKDIECVNNVKQHITIDNSENIEKESNGNLEIQNKKFYISRRPNDSFLSRPHKKKSSPKQVHNKDTSKTENNTGSYNNKVVTKKNSNSNEKYNTEKHNTQNNSMFDMPDFLKSSLNLSKDVIDIKSEYERYLNENVKSSEETQDKQNIATNKTTTKVDESHTNNIMKKQEIMENEPKKLESIKNDDSKENDKNINKNEESDKSEAFDLSFFGLETTKIKNDSTKLENTLNLTDTEINTLISSSLCFNGSDLIKEVCDDTKKEYADIVHEISEDKALVNEQETKRESIIDEMNIAALIKTKNDEHKENEKTDDCILKIKDTNYNDKMHSIEKNDESKTQASENSSKKELQVNYENSAKNHKNDIKMHTKYKISKPDNYSESDYLEELSKENKKIEEGTRDDTKDVTRESTREGIRECIKDDTKEGIKKDKISFKNPLKRNSNGKKEANVSNDDETNQTLTKIYSKNKININNYFESMNVNKERRKSEDTKKEEIKEDVKRRKSEDIKKEDVKRRKSEDTKKEDVKKRKSEMINKENKGKTNEKNNSYVQKKMFKDEIKGAIVENEKNYKKLSGIYVNAKIEEENVNEKAINESITSENTTNGCTIYKKDNKSTTTSPNESITTSPNESIAATLNESITMSLNKISTASPNKISTIIPNDAIKKSSINKSSSNKNTTSESLGSKRSSVKKKRSTISMPKNYQIKNNKMSPKKTSLSGRKITKPE